jgi:hypothetical protein
VLEREEQHDRAHRREHGHHDRHRRGEEPQERFGLQPRADECVEHVERRERDGQREQEQRRHFDRAGEDLPGVAVAAAGDGERAHARAVEQAKHREHAGQAGCGNLDAPAAQFGQTGGVAAQDAVQLPQCVHHP